MCQSHQPREDAFPRPALGRVHSTSSSCLHPSLSLEQKGVEKRRILKGKGLGREELTQSVPCTQGVLRTMEELRQSCSRLAQAESHADLVS